MEVSDMNNDDSVDDVESETTSNAPATDASGKPEDEAEAEAEELSRKIAEIERKVADGN
jgi:hypothetical protein